MERNEKKREYRKPEIRDWGTVTDLTAVGRTQDLGDVKDGSRMVTEG